MSILDNLMQRWGYTKQATPGDYSRVAPWQLEMANEQKYALPDYSLYYNQAELMQRLSWVYTAVSYTAAYAATVPLNVYKLKGEKSVDVPNHEFELLMFHPNPSQSRFDLLMATFAFMELNGNAYWWLNKADEKSKPDEIWLLPPYRLKPIPDGKLYLKGYEYDPGTGHLETLPTWQVQHFHSFHPTNEFVGLSGVEPIAAAAEADIGQVKWRSKLYNKSNGRLPGILGFADYIQEPTWGNIKSDIKTASQNAEYMLLRGLGKGGVELLAVPTPKDMEYIASRNLTKEEIFAVFAPGLASMLAVNATEANARSGKTTLIDFKIWPMMEQVAGGLTNNVLPLYESKQIKYRAEFEDIRITDRAMKLSEQAEYARTHTVNEIRDEFYGDDPLEDARGEMLIAQIGPSTKIDDDGEVEEPQPIPAQLQPQNMQPQAGDEITEQPEEETGENVEEQALSAEVKAELARWRRKALGALKQDKPLNFKFNSFVIPGPVYESVASALGKAKTEAEVAAAFTVTATEKIPYTDSIMTLAAELKRANDLLEKAGENG